MSRHRARKAKGLPPVLVRLIQAAQYSAKDAEGRDIRGAADALREFGALARWALPIYGLFVPNNNEVSIVVERVAAEHLDLEEARREFRDALKVVEVFAHRDPIESAHNHVQSVWDEAYFYAGLAFGVTLTDYSQRRCRDIARCLSVLGRCGIGERRTAPGLSRDSGVRKRPVNLQSDRAVTAVDRRGNCLPPR